MFILSQWFFLAIALAIIFAYLFPNFACKGGLIKSEYSINYGAVAVIFLLSGLSMDTRKLFQMIGCWKSHIFCQMFSFLFTSSIIFGFAELIRISNNEKINKYILIGFIVTGSTPTTVSSNVVMTKEANGNDSLSLIEVVIGNIMGAFISPLLIQLYLSKNTGFSFANPTTNVQFSSIYKEVMQNMGASLFGPLFVGQVAQYFFPGLTLFVKKYQIGKLGFCFVLLRLPMIPKNNKLVRLLIFDKKDSVAIMLCGAAKTIALGIPLIDAQWGNNSQIMAIISVPLVLYQTEQIFVAKLLVPILKKWIDSDKSQECVSDEESQSVEILNISTKSETAL
ncbi:hypothetical protein C6P40_001083 [Pichia californica]|uniref:Uncharacterized protein n=1 Tax=Pichia californica TaxID=460514 RepID=A0A9P6WR28_9ASCO|nr:hypothetical protein C6P40_001083 [[Candida] californica]